MSKKVQVNLEGEIEAMNIDSIQKLVEVVISEMTERDKYLYGRILTILEAVLDEPRLKATKDLVRDAIGLYENNYHHDFVRGAIRSYDLIANPRCASAQSKKQ